MADSVNWADAVEAQEKESLSTNLSELAVSKETAGEGDAETTAAEASLLTKILRTRLVDNTNDVYVQQKDPTSPLYSAKTFEELRLQPNLLKGVYSMEFRQPSKIQEKALPLLLADPPQNLIAQSQSGTGKTAAFVLAMLSRIDPSKPYPQAICLSPTFDLAQQTGKVITKMAQFCPEIKIGFSLRGSRTFQRGAAERITDHVLIGTSGTTLDWIIKFKVFDPKMINMFVLDEADVMIDTQGQQDQTIRIHKFLRKDCQHVLFSATYNEEVKRFAQRIIPDPNMIHLKRSEETLDNIKQFYVWCPSGDEGKYTALINIYGILTIGQCIVFCHTRKTALWLAQKMVKNRMSVSVLTGQGTVEQRVDILNRFREGKENMLITTNLCARGIDIDQVTLVVNFDIPLDVYKRPDCETYLHRIGRTGRFGKRGFAINFVDGRRSYDQLMTIQDHFKRNIEKLDTDDPEEIEKIQTTS